jgi:hypothetical protein
MGEIMDYKTIEKRFQAAHTILASERINRATFDALVSLLSGINPKLDKMLKEAAKAFRHVDQLQKSDVVALVTEALPEMTPEQKKRKKALLLFFKLWNDIKAEVARIEKEMAKSQGNASSASIWGPVVGFAKGPLGIITLIAAGIVMLKASEVSVTIKNVGCETITPPASMAIRIPGLKIPAVPLSSGDEVVANVPPLNFTVDATGNLARVTIVGMTYDFPLRGSKTSVSFNGKELIGSATDIRLGSQKEHTLVIACK